VLHSMEGTYVEGAHLNGGCYSRLFPHTGIPNVISGSISISGAGTYVGGLVSEWCARESGVNLPSIMENVKL
jgi:hypothetical protein